MPQVDPRLRGDDEQQERGGDFPRQNKKKETASVGGPVSSGKRVC